MRHYSYAHINIRNGNVYRDGIADFPKPLQLQENQLFIPDLAVYANPRPNISPSNVKINQSIKITVEITSRDNHTVLSQLQGGVDQTSSSLQHLLGDQNIACLSANLSADHNQFNVESSQPREYPLNQTSILWSWIVTPKQTVAFGLLEISFTADGKSACAPDKDPIVGPYSLAEGVLYDFAVTNSPPPPLTNSATSNLFVEMYNELGIGAIVTGVVTTLIAAFVAWICAQAWERRKRQQKAMESRTTPPRLHYQNNPEKEAPAVPEKEANGSRRH